MCTNKFKKYTTLAVFVLIGFCQIFGQVENVEDSSSSLIMSLGPDNLQAFSQIQGDLPIISSNSIYIQQIGMNNTTLTNVRADYSEINLVQNGNTNRASINVDGRTVIHNVVQNGNNNFLLEYGNTPNLNLDRNITQNGNGNGVVIFGSNSLTDKMILNLQGNSKTITIRNFN